VSPSIRDKSFLQKYLPGHFNNPAGLAVRLIRTGDRAALYAMWTAALGLLLTPLDMLLEANEKKLHRDAEESDLPIVLVCGPSRAGTTLAEQILIASTSPAYLNNLTSLFPRSPIIANRVFSRFVGRRSEEFRSYYGKSVGLGGPNDALYLWDRWLGEGHRSAAVSPEATLDLAGMRQLFRALRQEHGQPVVNKNNHLNCCAHLVAPALPQAHFICMRRQREHLAQSLLLGRRDIHGDLSVAYGIPSPVGGPSADPIADVCRQVLYHERMAAWQQAQVGPERFWIIQYEDLCRDPKAFALRVSDELFRGTAKPAEVSELKPFEPSTRIRVTPQEHDQILRTFEELDGHEEEYWVAPGAVPAASGQSATPAQKEVRA
jgi:hypothetical protein